MDTCGYSSRSVDYNCCWSSPVQSFSGPNPVGLMTIFYYLRFETPPIWSVKRPYLYTIGRGWLIYTPSHWIPFRRLLRLAGLRWRYSKTASTRSVLNAEVKIKVTLRLTASQSAHDQIFIIFWQLRSCFCGTPSLTGGRVCILYMLLALVSLVFLVSESLGTRDHI
jgi:hypothetical protein